ncbi:MAG: fumarylacetoacetate hydrolase family protein [Chloroflexi bacterium]|nr:fumarylacetoacetate hydrolase family protein [Chloroflexota bacterium]
MKIVRFSMNNNPRYGVLEDNIISELCNAPYCELTFSGQKFALEAVKLLAPCEPTKIVALGLNYHAHAKELDQKIPTSPLTFLKPSTAVIGPHENIIYPPQSQRVDYEGEFAAVIKKSCWCVPQEKALEYVLGYTCFNDITARDLQKLDGQWTRAKGFDTFACVGPWLETDLNPQNCQIHTYLNGQLRQDGNTADQIYSLTEIIAFISRVMTLLPGDIIATGTPPGIGEIKKGDIVRVEIDGIGSLINGVSNR